MQPFVVHGMLVYLSDGAESLGNEETRVPVVRASWPGPESIYLDLHEESELGCAEVSSVCVVDTLCRWTLHSAVQRDSVEC